jgi:hypothetical protein
MGWDHQCIQEWWECRPQALHPIVSPSRDDVEIITMEEAKLTKMKNWKATRGGKKAFISSMQP